MVVAYYTEGTLYEREAQRLRASCHKFQVPVHIVAVPNLGSWNQNTSYKPEFLLNMLDMFKRSNVIYVDADAEFRAFPELFWTLPERMKTDVAVYVFDRSEYKKSVGGTEVLSGTIFFKNTFGAREILTRWKRRTQENLNEWDQKSLEIVLKGQFDLLPGEYCKIFDRMAHVTKPVIVHHQASRKVRKNKGNLIETF